MPNLDPLLPYCHLMSDVLGLILSEQLDKVESLLEGEDGRLHPLVRYGINLSQLGRFQLYLLNRLSKSCPLHLFPLCSLLNFFYLSGDPIHFQLKQPSD